MTISRTVLKRLQLIIYGQVQGVFFRARTREKGRELNLSGWVKNEPDGTVKIVAEGEENDLQRLVDWVYNLRVDKLNISWEEATGEFASFSINYI